MNDGKGPVLLAKLAGLLALVGISSWSEATAVFTFILGVSATTRFYWRHVLRDLFERWGWVGPRRRRSTDPRGSDFTADRKESDMGGL